MTNKYRFLLFWTLAVPLYESAASSSDQFQFISPKSESRYHLPETTIIIRPGGDLSRFRPMNNPLVHVTGLQSGFHPGEIITSDDKRTFIFKPHFSFHPGEWVTVVIAPGLPAENGEGLPSRTIRFQISESGRNIEPQYLGAISPICPTGTFSGAIMNRCRTSSDYILPVDFPNVQVVINNQPDSGYLFLTNFMHPYEFSYLMILENSGSPIYFKQLNNRGCDFKKQPNGYLTYYQFAPNFYYMMDTTYTVVDSFQCGNGYSTDFHDLQLMPNGHALLMSFDSQVVDMSHLVTGGDTAATVTGLIIQELDVSKQVIFQWRSWDHYEITDASHADFTQSFFTYVHGNALEFDLDGHILLSARNMDEITKINRQTGEIIWRLGGKRNQFEFINDPDGFSFQHDIRRLSNGHITIFDNGVYHTLPYARAVEYELDEDFLKVKKVFEYRHDPEIRSRKLGNVQRLSNGNTLIGWGLNRTAVTEIRPDGTTVFELEFPEDVYSYRVFRFPWSGSAAAPTLWVDTLKADPVLHFTQFGVSDVVKFYVYEEQASTWQKIDSTSNTCYTLTGLVPGYNGRYRVSSLREDAGESPPSNPVEIGWWHTDVVNDCRDNSVETFHLYQNYPNPFNSETIIIYHVPTASRISLEIMNVLGQQVALLVDEERKQAGLHQGVFDAGDLPSGIYFCRLKSRWDSNEIILLNRKLVFLR